jgi:hypothetical protein
MGNRAFALGKVVLHEEALRALERNGQDVSVFLCRHGRGEWGKAMTVLDMEVSEHGLETAGPVRSAHYLRDGEILLIHTNAERTKTDVYLYTP